ncbi:MAG: ABC transporter ATP-binding protein [Elusimicrobia bacterium]|nr:ABC transporter ATP-binding protein [Elusimicrobiota bacterium]
MMTFKDVYLGYGRNVVLEKLNFTIQKNDFVGIIGQNGSGKTTVLKAINNSLKPQRGEIFREPDIKIGYVIQRQYLDTIFPFTVKEIVMMGRYGKIGPLKFPEPGDENKVEEVLTVTGIYDLKNKLYRELSGGQRQRVLVARALASEPNLLLLDEPTNDLDIKGTEQILKLVQKIHSELGITVIVVSHLLLTILNYAHKIIFLKDKKAAMYSLEEIFSEEMLTQIYEYPVKIGTIHNKKYIVPEDINGNTQ